MRNAMQPGRRGFALIATGISGAAVLGMLGLAVDLGRLYIIRNEAQTYADSAALAAALELDGTHDGMDRACAAVDADTNRWNFQTAAFSGAEIDFSVAAAGPWETEPVQAAGYRFVRVRISRSAPLFLMPVVSGGDHATIGALAIAGQIEKPEFREGLVPFSPFTHSAAPPDFGYVPGLRYTLRWGSNPKVGVNTCEGDNAQQWVDKAKAGSASERGYIEDNSSAIIRLGIEDSYQSRPLAAGDTVLMTGGNKQTQRDSLVARIGQDSDPNAHTYSEYVAGKLGNGRRIVAVPINTGYPDNTVVGFAAFFLLHPSEYDAGGVKPFCAEYVGPYVEGGRNGGAGAPGAYAVRLVR